MREKSAKSLKRILASNIGVPTKLLDTIDDRSYDRIASKYRITAFLGSGLNGVALACEDNTVLKITSDRTEALASHMLIGARIPHVLEIYAVEKIKNGLYCISCKRYRKSKISSKVWDSIDSFISDIICLDDNCSSIEADEFANRYKKQFSSLSNYSTYRKHLLNASNVFQALLTLKALGIEFIDFDKSNIMCDENGDIVIIDLGWSKFSVDTLVATL